MMLFKMVKSLNPKCWHAGTYQGHDEGCFTIISYKPAEAVPMEYEGGGEGSSTWRETTGAPDGWLVTDAFKEGA